MWGVVLVGARRFMKGDGYRVRVRLRSNLHNTIRQWIAVTEAARGKKSIKEGGT